LNREREREGEEGGGEENEREEEKDTISEEGMLTSEELSSENGILKHECGERVEGGVSERKAMNNVTQKCTGIT
jgi:hypothetical protein